MPRRNSGLYSFLYQVLMGLFNIFSNCKCHSQCCECDMDNTGQTPTPSPVFVRKEDISEPIYEGESIIV